MKQTDLHTTLHTKYNTFPSAIQDPEAFHHDVYELSTLASDISEFEQLMEDRKMQRLKELNNMLEDASFEIIGCPRLIGTDQWVHAVQLFRTRSLDSLVRYFASYLPQDHPWHRDSDSAINSSGSDAVSPISPIDFDGPILFDEPEEDETMGTNEPPKSFSTDDVFPGHSKRAMTGRSEDSGVSVNERHQYQHDPNSQTPIRTLSVSESEPDHTVASLQDSMPTLNDSTATTPYQDPATPSTSISDLSDADDHAESQEKDALVTTIVDEEVLEGYLSISHTHIHTMDSMDSDTSTPKAAAARSPAAPATPMFDAKPSPLLIRSLSANRFHPHHAHPTHVEYHESRKHVATRQLRRRDASLDRDRKAACVPGGRASRAREMSPEGVRPRTRARRRRAAV